LRCCGQTEVAILIHCSFESRHCLSSSCSDQDGTERSLPVIVGRHLVDLAPDFAVNGGGPSIHDSYHLPCASAEGQSTTHSGRGKAISDRFANDNFSLTRVKPAALSESDIAHFSSSAG